VNEDCEKVLQYTNESSHYKLCEALDHITHYMRWSDVTEPHSHVWRHT